MRDEPVWYLVPDGVVQYIGKHQLYPGRPALDPTATSAPHSTESSA
jgi:nicotinate-nucleotide adenylyltransferase